MEVITHDKFMKEVYPILSGAFDQYTHRVHSDIVPLWNDYKQATLGFHDALILSSWSSISLSSIFERTDYGLVHSITNRVKIVGEKLTSYSIYHEGYLGEFSNKITANYMLFQHDPELRATLESFILAKRNQLIRFTIPEKLKALGVQGRLLCEWRYGRRGLATEVSQTTISNFHTNSLTHSEFYMPVMKVIDEVLSYLKKAPSSSNTTSFNTQEPLQILHQQRAILLGTLQNI